MCRCKLDRTVEMARKCAVVCMIHINAVYMPALPNATSPFPVRLNVSDRIVIIVPQRPASVSSLVMTTGQAPHDIQTHTIRHNLHTRRNPRGMKELLVYVAMGVSAMFSPDAYPLLECMLVHACAANNEDPANENLITSTAFNPM
jgi:hypothetical protein